MFLLLGVVVGVMLVAMLAMYVDASAASTTQDFDDLFGGVRVNSVFEPEEVGTWQWLTQQVDTWVPLLF